MRFGAMACFCVLAGALSRGRAERGHPRPLDRQLYDSVRIHAPFDADAQERRCHDRRHAFRAAGGYACGGEHQGAGGHDLVHRADREWPGCRHDEQGRTDRDAIEGTADLGGMDRRSGPRSASQPAQRLRHRLTPNLSFNGLKLHPNLLKGHQRARLRPPDPHPGRRHPAGAGRARRARLRVTGSGKTAAFLLPILHQAHRPAARHDARAGDHADARAGGADSGGSQRPRGAHADHRARRSTAASAWGRRSTPSAAAWTCSSPRRAGCSITSGRRTPS